MPEEVGPLLAMDTDEACLSSDKPVAMDAAGTVPEAGGPFVAMGTADVVCPVLLSVTLVDPAALVTAGSDVFTAAYLSPDGSVCRAEFKTPNDWGCEAPSATDISHSCMRIN